jgi:hypothetical protein
MVQQKYQLIKDLSILPHTFFFQCPQSNLLRNEYDIPFINIYHFNKINDFINPALIHDAKLVCKFIKEAVF